MRSFLFVAFYIKGGNLEVDDSDTILVHNLDYKVFLVDQEPGVDLVDAAAHQSDRLLLGHVLLPQTIEQRVQEVTAVTMGCKLDFLFMSSNRRGTVRRTVGCRAASVRVMTHMQSAQVIAEIERRTLVLIISTDQHICLERTLAKRCGKLLGTETTHNTRTTSKQW